MHQNIFITCEHSCQNPHKDPEVNQVELDELWQSIVENGGTAGHGRLSEIQKMIKTITRWCFSDRPIDHMTLASFYERLATSTGNVDFKIFKSACALKDKELPICVLKAYDRYKWSLKNIVLTNEKFDETTKAKLMMLLDL